MDKFIVRKIHKKSGDKYQYKYYDKRDNEIKDTKTINDVKKDLYIPPAYDNVKINLRKSEKFLQLVNNKSRPQYIYNNNSKNNQ